MGKLSNDLLREKTMKEFLTAMGLDLTGVEISSIEGLFSYSFQDKKIAEQFSIKLNKIFQGDEVQQAHQTISLSEIIDQEMAKATCIDGAKLPIHKSTCAGVLEIVKKLGTNFTFSQELGVIEITLPDPMYAQFLNILQYPNMKFTSNGKLVIDIKSYLKNIPTGVVKIEGLNDTQVPLVFLAAALKSKQMYYASKQLPDNTLEVTPYFFVPEASKPPVYHFVLDKSGSMGSSLPDLRKSVIELAKQLFVFQPDAKVTITTFSNGVHHIGSYNRHHSLKLESDVKDILVASDTPLYEVTSDFLNLILKSADHNNILLFTDGQEGGSKAGSEGNVKMLIENIGTELSNTNIRNKFYIFSYGVQQSDLMKKVAATFLSDVIDTQSADFLAAQNDPELMKRWAAARELFVSRIVVEDKTGVKSEDKYALALDMSGQLASLKPRICQPGEILEITLADGDGKQIIQSTKKLASNPAISYAGLIGDLGLNATNAKQPVPEFLDPTVTVTPPL